MISSKGKLGRHGVIWVDELKRAAESSPQSLTEWQFQFVESLVSRVEYYGEDTHLSEKQANIVNEIAEKLGLL